MLGCLALLQTTSFNNQQIWWSLHVPRSKVKLHGIFMGCGHLSYGNPYNGNPSPWMDWPSPNMAQAQHGSTINRDPKWLSPKTEWFAVHSTNYSKVVNLIRPNKRLFPILPEIGWYQPSKTWGLQHWVLLHYSFSNPKKQMLLLPTSFQVELLLVAQIPWRMARPKKDPNSVHYLRSK